MYSTIAYLLSRFYPGDSRFGLIVHDTTVGGFIPGTARFGLIIHDTTVGDRLNMITTSADVPK